MGRCARPPEVADTALPSVVTISATHGQQGGTGSGVVIRSSGYILTDDHVISVAANGGTVSVMFSDGHTAGATIVGRDPFTDLGVIKANAGEPDLPTIAIGASRSGRVGQPVVAVGSPLGLTSTVTSGIVSALDRYVRVPAGGGVTAHLVGAIQTDASINPGNSGGALVDCAARLVGINTAGASVPDSGGGSVGLGFAIPVDLAKPLADELITNGKVNHPSFGMQVQAIPREVAEQAGQPPGLFVQEVTPGGPAEKAGIRPRDVIVVDRRPAGHQRRRPDRQDPHDAGGRYLAGDLRTLRRLRHCRPHPGTAAVTTPWKSTGSLKNAVAPCGCLPHPEGWCRARPSCGRHTSFPGCRPSGFRRGDRRGSVAVVRLRGPLRLLGGRRGRP